jgi:predicted signal transduction protein with EAL and GGDEF domain
MSQLGAAQGIKNIMRDWLSSLLPNKRRHSSELLIEQYATLRRQIPLMYALMFINVLFWE